MLTNINFSVIYYALPYKAWTLSVWWRDWFLHIFTVAFMLGYVRLSKVK